MESSEVNARIAARMKDEIAWARSRYVNAKQAADEARAKAEKFEAEAAIQEQQAAALERALAVITQAIQ